MECMSLFLRTGGAIMINFMYMTSIAGFPLPIAYGDQQDEDIPSIVDILQDSIPSGHSIIWVRLPKSSTNPKLSNLLFPLLCRYSDDDPDSFIPIYTEAFNDNMACVDYDDDEDAAYILSTASNYSNKVPGSIYDFEDVYVGYMMSYDAYIIRDSKKQSVKTLKASVARLGKNIEETEDDTYLQEYNRGKKILEIFERKLAEQQAAKAAAQVESNPAPVEESEDTQPEQEQTTENSNSKVVGFDEEASAERVEQMEAKVRETLEAFKKDEKEKEEEEEEVEDEVQETDEVQDVEQTASLPTESLDYTLYTEESGKATVVYDMLDQIEEQANAINAVEKLTSYDIPRFIPHTVKFEYPIGVLIDGKGSKLAGMSYDDFFTCMEDYANTPDDMLMNIPSSVKVADEVIHILKLNNTSVTLRNLLYIFKPEDKSEGGLRMLYELLKYYTEGISPNGLYNNLYYFLYLYNVELDLRGASAVSKNYKLSSALANFACDYRGLTLEEQSDASEDAGTFADDTEEILVAQMFKDDVDRGNSAIAEFITDVITGKVPFSTYFDDKESGVLSVEKICILASYGYFLNVHHESLAELDFESLNVCIKPYKLYLECFAVAIDPTTLGLMLDEINRFESSLYDTTDDGLAKAPKAVVAKRRAEVFAANRYNSVLALLKDASHLPYTPENTKSSNTINELDTEIKSKIDKYQVYKQIIYVTENPDGKIKKSFLGVVAFNPQEPISSQYQFFPAYSSAYMDLVQLGVKIEGLLNNEDLKPVACKLKKDGNGITKFVYCPPKLYSKEASTVCYIKRGKSSKVELKDIVNLIKGKLSKQSAGLRSIILPNWANADKDIINSCYKDLIE